MIYQPNPMTPSFDPLPFYYLAAAWTVTITKTNLPANCEARCPRREGLGITLVVSLVDFAN